MIQVIIDHWKLQTIAKDNAEGYDQLRESFAGKNLPTRDDMVAGKGWQSFEAMVNDINDLPDWAIEAASFKPVRPLKLMVDGRIDTKAVKDALAVHQVHLPGNELLRIHEVQVQEDCCTDHLQDLLKQGWRIIAVCPQASRRPDYILGRL